MEGNGSLFPSIFIFLLGDSTPSAAGLSSICYMCILFVLNGCVREVKAVRNALLSVQKQEKKEVLFWARYS